MGTEGVGDVYADKLAVGHTNPYRAVTKSVTLFHVIIRAEVSDIYVGREGFQEMPLNKNTEKELFNVDLADLYFKNAASASVVHILGTTKNEAKLDTEIALLGEIKEVLTK